MADYTQYFGTLTARSLDGDNIKFLLDELGPEELLAGVCECPETDPSIRPVGPLLALSLPAKNHVFFFKDAEGMDAYQDILSNGHTHVGYFAVEGAEDLLLSEVVRKLVDLLGGGGALSF